MLMSVKKAEMALRSGGLAASPACVAVLAEVWDYESASAVCRDLCAAGVVAVPFIDPRLAMAWCLRHAAL